MMAEKIANHRSGRLWSDKVKGSVEPVTKTDAADLLNVDRSTVRIELPPDTAERDVVLCQNHAARGAHVRWWRCVLTWFCPTGTSVPQRRP